MSQFSWLGFLLLLGSLCMWFLIRSALGMAVFVLLGYAMFFVSVGGKPLASHAYDVWQSKVVQQKVNLVREGVRSNIEHRLAEAATSKVQRGAVAPEELVEEDRRRLEQVIAAKDTLNR